MHGAVVARSWLSLRPKFGWSRGHSLLDPAEALDIMPHEATELNTKTAALQQRHAKAIWPCLVDYLLATIWWLSCCCCFQRQKPFGLTKQSKKEDWSAHKKDTSCPAQLKVSTINKRTIGRSSSNSLTKQVVTCNSRLTPILQNLHTM